MWSHDTPLTPLWRNVSFTLMWTSTAASGFGDTIMRLGALAMLGALAASADSTAQNAAIQFFFFLPYIVFALPAGWLADHLPRKWMMLLCDEARAVILLIAVWMVPAGVSALPSIPEDQHWKVFAALFAVGTMAAIFYPNRAAIVPQIIPPRQLQAGNAMIIGIGVIAGLIGYLIGGWLIDPEQASTVRRGLLIAALMYAVSGTFFAFLRVADARTRDLDDERKLEKRSLMQAVRYLLSHRQILQLIILHTAIWGGAMTVFNAIPALGKGNFGLEDEALLSHISYLSATMGAGLLAGAGVVAWIGTRHKAFFPMTAGLIMTGALTLVMALSPFYWLMLTAGFFMALFGNITVISTISLLQSISPDYIRGRIMGIDAMGSTLASVLVSLIIWQLPDADAMILPCLWVYGPLITLYGLYLLYTYSTRGHSQHRSINFVTNFAEFYLRVWQRATFHGKHHVPNEGPVILAPNHTTGIDGCYLQVPLHRPVRFLMMTSYKFRILNWFWDRINPVFLVHEKGKEAAEPGMKQVRTILAALKEDAVVCIFPEGHLQRVHRALKPLQPGVATIGRLSKAWVVPTWIEGTPRSEKLWVHFLKPGRSSVTFGEAYKIDRSLTPEEATADLRRRLLELETQVNTRLIREGREPSSVTPDNPNPVG